MPTNIPVRLVAMILGGALAIAALVWLIQSRAHWKDVAEQRKANLELVCATVRDAAGNPKLDCRNMAQQVRLLGEGVRDLKAAVANQNRAVDAIGEQSKTQQAEAAKAAQSAEKRAREAERVSDSLKRSARAGGANAADCEASDALKERWK